MQVTYDLKTSMQALLDANSSALQKPNVPRAVIEQYHITSDWTEAKIDPTPAISAEALTFKPAPADRKVNAFNFTDDDGSVQFTLLNKPAPDFTATTLDGKTWSLKDQRGKVVLLQFWSSSAQNSIPSLTPFSDLRLDFPAVTMVGVNQDHPSMHDQTRRLIAGRNATLPTLIDADKTIGNAYRVIILPRTILIDKEGIIRSITTDYNDAGMFTVASRLSDLLAGRPIPERTQPAPFQPPLRSVTPPTTPTPPAPAPEKP
jgi:peroxiredoxin